jgi:hypothetical protein
MKDAKIETISYRVEAFEPRNLNTANSGQTVGEFRVDRVAVRVSDIDKESRISALNKALRPYGRVATSSLSSRKI